MIHFFDTSALVKRYYEEEGSETVDGIVESDENRILISSLSVVETVSAFRRKINTGELSRTDAETLISSFFDEALDQFVIVPMEEAVLRFSFDLILDDDLRTLDSLQLSAALATDAEVEEFVFVCADSELISVAQDHGLDTVNPVQVFVRFRRLPAGGSGHHRVWANSARVPRGHLRPGRGLKPRSVGARARPAPRRGRDPGGVARARVGGRGRAGSAREPRYEGELLSTGAIVERILDERG